MIILNRDGSLHESAPAQQVRCYAEVSTKAAAEQQSIFDKIMTFAFDVLGVQHLEVRVRDTQDVCVCGTCGVQ